jgi:hypothetical protein
MGPEKNENETTNHPFDNPSDPNNDLMELQGQDGLEPTETATTTATVTPTATTSLALDADAFISAEQESLPIDWNVLERGEMDSKKKQHRTVTFSSTQQKERCNITTATTTTPSLSASTTATSFATTGTNTTADDDEIIPGPPQLFRATSTPGAFREGGRANGDRTERALHLIDSDDDDDPELESQQQPQQQQRLPALISATLVSEQQEEATTESIATSSTTTSTTLTCTDINNECIHSRKLILAHAQPLESQRLRLCRILLWGLALAASCVACAVGITLAVDPKKSPAAPMSPQELEARMVSSTLQALYLVTWGAATHCFQYETPPPLSLQCGSDDSTTATMVLLQSPDQVNLDAIKISADLAIFELCDRLSYSGLRCSSLLGERTETYPTVNTTNTTATTITAAKSDDYLKGIDQPFGSTLGAQNQIQMGQERRVVILCAGETSDDLVLRATLDRSVAADCQHNFYSTAFERYFGGSTSTYVSLNQFCLSETSWHLKTAASCDAGAAFRTNASSLLYCQESKACVAAQTCASTNLICEGYSCSTMIRDVQETIVSDCTMHSLQTITPAIWDLVEQGLPDSAVMTSQFQQGLLDPSNPDLDIKDDNQKLLAAYTRQTNHAIVWGAVSSCSDTEGPDLSIECGIGGVVALLDVKGATCTRQGKNLVLCQMDWTTTQGTVILTCGGDAEESLTVMATLSENNSTTNNDECSQHLYTVNSTKTYGGATAAFMSIGHYCYADNVWRLDVSNSTCSTGHSAFLQTDNEKICYAEGECSTVRVCNGNGGNCTGSNACHAKVGPLVSSFQYYNCSVDQNNADLFRDLWPSIDGQMSNVEPFMEGVIDVMHGRISAVGMVGQQ